MTGGDQDVHAVRAGWMTMTRRRAAICELVDRAIMQRAAQQMG
jgi:hypothetical protein